MIRDRIGLQLYNVREELENNFWGTIDQVAEIGYRWVEFPGMSPEKQAFLLEHAAEIRAHLDGLGIKTACIAIAADDLNEIERYIAAAQQLDCGHIGVPICFFPDKAAVMDMAGRMDAAGRLCRKAGIQLHYHNHFHEFAPMEDSCPMDILLENTSAENLCLELDVFWAARAGKNPLELYHRWQDRILLVHLKDAGEAARPLDLFQLIPADTPIDPDVFIKYALNPAFFTEIGNGILNIPDYVREMSATGKVKNFIIEQDYSSIGAMNSARISLESLRNRI